ncbi:hypothetical protein [Streptomyces sp. NPDC060031]|uniref:hypothetical protein n=1 Tax=Streptomyces sp. NPDC060031 TaxID=3347043 RepID=UPI0036A0DD1E
MVAWLLAHDKIEVPMWPTVASLVLAGAGGATHRFRLDDPWLALADDAVGEDVLSGWSTDADADALAELAAGEFGASVSRLTAPGTGPVAVLGEVRVIDRFRSGSGGLRMSLAWPSGLRGAAAERSAAGVVRHGVAYAGPGEGCVQAPRLWGSRPGLLVPGARGRGGPGDGVASRRWDPLCGAGRTTYGVARLAVTPTLRPAGGNRRSERP